MKARFEQGSAEVRQRLATVLGIYREMQAEGKDRTECQAFVITGLLMGTTDPGRLVSMLAVAVSELVDAQDDVARLGGGRDA